MTDNRFDRRRFFGAGATAVAGAAPLLTMIRSAQERGYAFAYISGS